MAKYLIEARYTNEGVTGLIKEGGSARREATAKAVASVGGTMEAFYFALGDVDAFVIVDVPDEASLVALELVVNASGRVKSKSVKLIAPDDIDKAVKKAVAYRPPGG